MRRRAGKPIKDTAVERERFRARALQAFLIVLLGFAVLSGRFVYLQVIKHDEFATRSEANRVKLRAVAPSRGLIYDRNGVLLADNQAAFRLELIPEQVGKRKIDATLAALREIIEISDEEIERFHEERRAKRAFQPIPIRLRLSEAEVARFAVNRHRFNGVDVVAYQTRVYPLAETTAHVVGYVGRISRQDLEGVDESRYSATTHFGKTGIERFYESVLHGEVGYEQIETNAQGRTLKVLDSQPAMAGRNLILTLDAQLQRIAVEGLAGRAGAVVAVIPGSGEVLALVSQPSFDPNLFVNGISHADYARLNDSRKKPLYNRAVLGQYEPGSTLKPFVALAGLELELREPDDTVVSRGWWEIPGDRKRRYHDWKRGGHGEVDVQQAIAQSVNTYFYKLALDLGTDRMHDYLRRFGFGERTGIDLSGERRGLIPTHEWSRRTRNRPVYPGETVISGIGQTSLATPLQLARATAALAARGELPQLHLLRGTAQVGDEVSEVPVWRSAQIPMQNPEHWQLVIDGMQDVMHGAQGTARAVMSEDDGFLMAGKTGTAQVYGRAASEIYASVDELPEELRHHALFVGFAPVDDPQIAVAVVVENGGGGSRVAAPIAKDLIAAWLERTPVAEALTAMETP